jgi:hypothetical protein
MATTDTAQEREKHPTKYFCLNQITNRFDEVFPESEIGDHELVIPKYWAGRLGYVTVPGTEFYGPIPEDHA